MGEIPEDVPPNNVIPFRGPRKVVPEAPEQQGDQWADLATHFPGNVLPEETVDVKLPLSVVFYCITALTEYIFSCEQMIEQDESTNTASFEAELRRVKGYLNTLIEVYEKHTIP